MNTTFTKVPKTLGISDFRAGLAGHLAKAKKNPLIITDRRGSDTFVVITLDAYNELVEIWARAQKNKDRKDSYR